MGEEDRWAMSHAEEDGQPVLLRFRSDLPVKETARFPFLISILWIYDGSKNGGMPDDRTLAMMDRVEDSLGFIEIIRSDVSIDGGQILCHNIGMPFEDDLSHEFSQLAARGLSNLIRTARTVRPASPPVSTRIRPARNRSE